MSVIRITEENTTAVDYCKHKALAIERRKPNYGRFQRDRKGESRVTYLIHGEVLRVGDIAADCEYRILGRDLLSICHPREIRGLWFVMYLPAK